MTLKGLLQTRSLRFWIMAGMFLAIAPVAAAAVGGFVLLNSGVIGSFQDLTHRQRAEIIPAQRIGLSIWDASLAVDGFVEDGQPTDQSAFRAARTQIDAQFGALAESVKTAPAASALVVRAGEEWKTAEGLGGELTSVLRPSEDPVQQEATERFDGAVQSASDSLAAAIDYLESDIAEDEQDASLAYERALWLAGIAAGVCLLTIAIGVLLIGRVMAASVDRLVDGAHRFAEGDRSHRIDVRIPPELRRVASEFNRMITKIHAYEDILADRALKDVLTGLPNRRAFDEAIGRQWDRARQFGEPFAMLHIDVDHFKRVNDTHGHAAGDEVLRQAADTMTKQLRSAHPVFRLGGEEFAVLVPNARLAEAQVIAERLRTAVAAVVTVPVEAEIRVTISIGVTDSAGFGSPDEMSRAADAALYRAKTQGRDRVVATDDTDRSREDAA